jgi:hypothetical protein
VLDLGATPHPNPIGIITPPQKYGCAFLGCPRRPAVGITGFG